MREILFRGKRADTGKWLYWSGLGRLSEVYNGRLISGNVGYSHWAYECIYLDDQTIGQYTGLTDKNGKRIFEGDIVHCLARMDEANCVVIFEEGEFRLVPERNYKTYTTGGGYHAVRCFVKEVIGNIHDNPELMKEVT